MSYGGLEKNKQTNKHEYRLGLLPRPSSIRRIAARAERLHLVWRFKTTILHTSSLASVIEKVKNNEQNRSYRVCRDTVVRRVC